MTRRITLPVLLAGLLVSLSATKLSADTLQLSVNHLTACPVSGCFGWDPTGWIALSVPNGTRSFAAIDEVSQLRPMVTMRFHISHLTGQNIDCQSDIYNSCKVILFGSHATVIFASTLLNPPPGIRPGQLFLINFGCATANCGWPTAPYSIVVRSTAVIPEPSTMLLVLSGIMGLASAKARAACKMMFHKL